MSPIIDVHVHLFHALDIPIEGYLRSRRSERRPPLDPEYLVQFLPGPDLFTYLADRMRDRCITRRLGREEKGWIYSGLLKWISCLMHQRLDHWEDALTRTLSANAHRLETLWPDVDLFVPLIVDYEYGFKNTLDVPIRDQVEAMTREVVLPGAGRFHPFVPFDPTRELAWRHNLIAPDGQREETSSLSLVREAIETKGFIGVKVYNSLGYRPLYNGDPKTHLHRMRLAVRNDKTPYLFPGEAYDDVLRELYAYCVQEEVPITAHCAIGGIEAYPQASEDFCAAPYWKGVLEAFPDLRLNLAHFGWNLGRHRGYRGPKTWVKEICDLMVSYSHVYADVSQHEVTIRGLMRRFVQDYRALIRDYGLHLDRIRRRLLYGSDWHVLTRLPREKTFPARYRRLLLEAGLYDSQEISLFYGENALDFLGLRPGMKNYARLGRFYRENRILPPTWYVKAATRTR